MMAPVSRPVGARAGLQQADWVYVYPPTTWQGDVSKQWRRVVDAHHNLPTMPALDAAEKAGSRADQCGIQLEPVDFMGQPRSEAFGLDTAANRISV